MSRTGAGMLVAVSPGSRSTPLVLALSARPELELVDVIDERAAAFFALGHARASGELSVVLATSGTAPAHWYPALLEASESHVPLLLLSADRPTELQGCAAPQTIDQVHLFGHHVRYFADLGDPHDSDAWRRHVERTIKHACDRAMGIEPGPAHVNVRARKPLEPTAPLDATDHMALALASALAAVAGSRGAEGLRIVPRRAVVDEPELKRLAARIGSAARPLFLVGPLAPHEDVAPVLSLARAVGALLAVEWGSQLRGRPGVIANYDLLLEARSRAALLPDLVVQLGATPTPSAYERWVKTVDGTPLPRMVIGPRLSDAGGTAEDVVLGSVSAIASALLPHVTSASDAARAAWAQELFRDAGLAQLAIEAELAESAPISEGAAVHAAFSALPDGATVVLGNSLPIRLADRFGQSSNHLRVIVQRGVNGIDGLVAGALGAARAGNVTLAVLGDVTTLHDVGSLALMRRLGLPLVLLVLDNQGGRIFEQLPIGQREDLSPHMPHFVTEHGLDIAAIARGFGLSAARLNERTALEAHLRQALRSPEPSVVVAEVPPHDARDRESRIRARLEKLFRERP